MDFKITSSSFKDGDAIPSQFTCDGRNVSPALEWQGAPSGTRSFALIMDDPDAPMGTWVHWVIFNIPPDADKLKENIPTQKILPDQSRQGINDFREIGYGGPCPPRGTHRYFFKLYTLDRVLALEAGASKAQVLKAMEGHILAQAQLIGTYRR